jgi:hypothetical protein
VKDIGAGIGIAIGCFSISDIDSDPGLERRNLVSDAWTFASASEKGALIARVVVSTRNTLASMLESDVSMPEKIVSKPENIVSILETIVLMP